MSKHLGPCGAKEGLLYTSNRKRMSAMIGIRALSMLHMGLYWLAGADTERNSSKLAKPEHEL
jgi:hypothetical protein